MVKELQDLVWSCLPKEFKEEVKYEYSRVATKVIKSNYDLGFMNAHEGMYGIHNLISDAEGEEALIVPRSKVQELFDTGDKYSCSTLAALFGPKCLPDETKDGTMDETKEPKPAEPKFKVGQFAMFKGRKVEITGYKKGYLYPYYVYVLTENYGTSVKESDLESYTEPKNEESELLRAESVEESRIADEESHLRNFSQETANCDKNFDNILKDGFSKERRLNIAAMAMQGMIASGEDYSGDCKFIVEKSFEIADQLIKKAEE